MRRGLTILAGVCGLIAPVVSSALGGGPGPDVLVGELPDANAYGSDESGLIYAFDIGTAACSIGNVQLRWIGASNQHPVIAQNVFRLNGGRIEQIGASWAKHGFYASSGNLCGACTPASGPYLGVGCSDPYDAGINGFQFSLGPRSQVNASTGAFPYPAAWPPYSGPLARRVQIAAADLDPALNTGARYFAEGIYICPDDAAAGNGWNNASHRAIAFSPAAPFDPAWVGPAAERGEPAIMAWKEQGLGPGTPDPGVTLVPLDVPGDGRFWLGAKAIDNGDGSWRYEYAVYNLNSDRSAAAFTVPLGSGGGPPSPASRFPPCHSGEPYDNSPWIADVTAPSVMFHTAATYAQNANAGALRWGTLGNFRFTSTLAPAPGSVLLGLFKPGAGPAEIAVRLPTPGGAAVSAGTPVNDQCAGAIPLHSGSNGASLLGATASAASDCAGVGADAWFTLTYPDPCEGPIAIDTCGSDFPANIAVYAPASACGSLGVPLACSAPMPSCGDGPSASSVTFATSGQQTFLVRVSSASGTAGHAMLNVSLPACVLPVAACCRPNGTCLTIQGVAACTLEGGVFFPGSASCTPNPCPQPPAPANDLCANAVAVADTLAGGAPVAGTNAQSLTDSPTDGCFNSGKHDVWYAYTPMISGPVIIDTCLPPAGGVVLDTVVSVRTACAGSDLLCNDDSPQCAAGPSYLTVEMTGGLRYLIRVAGYSTATGDFILRIRGGGGVLTGACCRGVACSVGTGAQCTGPATRFAGLNTVCNAPGNNVQPCCRADFRQDGVVTVLDIFEFLGAWFAGSPEAVFGGDGTGTPTAQSIFSFLAAWFAGGC